MALKNQIYVYSVDTSYFYNDNERKIHDILNEHYQERKPKKDRIDKIKEIFLLMEEENDVLKKEKLEKKHDVQKLTLELEGLQEEVRELNKYIKSHKELLYVEMSKNEKIRILDDSLLQKNNKISVFESTLTRTIGAKTNELNENIIVVQTYFFTILEDIIKNGFYWKGEKYKVFTASAGQIRTKKTVFIKESVWEDHSLSLMCGLTIDRINDRGGMNINKFLAYLALCNSATDLWKGFDIDKTIVVEDFESSIVAKVDFIDDKTYEIKEGIEMDVEINHTDGCGMILPSLSKKSFMTRLPFVKGLLVSFPYDKFIREHNRSNKEKIGKVKDIYGKEYDILKDDIQVIFTKSQFKMWKYYDSWDEYKENFKKYGCQAGIANSEPDKFNKATLNYQMLQTLTDITNDELESLLSRTQYTIKSISSVKKTMLKVLGVTEANENKNSYQKALEIYPELLQDTYSKEILKQLKKKVVKGAKHAKLELDSVYTFICPDLYAFCEFLFKPNQKPQGILKNGEVSCAIYSKKEKLDCLRSPHLYREHAVRNNIVNDVTKKWFTTNGLYTSIHDPISKILMFDCDGDAALVCADELLISIAERNMKGIYPLYYNMAKANSENITNDSIFNGLQLAYKGGNIGIISNEITKIWNDDDISLMAIKILCMENNFVIDYAKTLYKPTRPKEINELIKSYTKKKTPKFFMYAKDKKSIHVEKVNNSTVNRLSQLVKSPIVNFKKAKLGEFDHKMLMRDADVEIDEAVIIKYRELDLSKRFMINEDIENLTSNDKLYAYKEFKSELLKLEPDEYKLTDMLIKYLYIDKNSSYKTSLWSCFGEIIVENLNENIAKHLSNTIQCEVCNTRIEKKNNKTKYCMNCSEIIKKEQNKIADMQYKRKKRENRKTLVKDFKIRVLKG